MNIGIIALCAIFAIGMVFVMRIMRKGLGTYSEKQKEAAATIADTEQKIRAENLSIPFSEHMIIMYHAMQELVLFSENPDDYAVWQDSKHIYLDTPNGVVKVNFAHRIQKLNCKKKNIYGGELWEIHGYDADKIEYDNMNAVVRALSQYVVPNSVAEKNKSIFINSLNKDVKK